MSIWLRRREFVAALGGAASLPLAVGAQQPALPVIWRIGGPPGRCSAGASVLLACPGRARATSGEELEAMNGSFRVAVVMIALSLATASSFAARLSSASQAKPINKIEAYALIGERSVPLNYRKTSSSTGIADPG